MRMIPSAPPSRASNAERKVFYALKNIAQSNATVCLHSLGLPRHAYKACCELDFVILGPEGLFALEVKGGGVSRNDNGIWEMTDRDGEVHRHKEGPFKQVQGNYFALLDQLKKHISIHELSAMPKGWGVVLPDCRFDVSSVEWDDATIADQRWMGQFANWLENLIRYYQRKCGANAAYKMNPDTLRRLTNLLRPIFEKQPSVGGDLDTAEMTLQTLTDEQCRVVDIVAANAKVLCSGGAGTGKTFLAMELARQNIRKDYSVLFCCSSPWLRHYLDVKLNHPNLKVLTIDMVRRGASKNPKYDTVIVDEAQDMMNLDDLDVLDQSLDGGLTDGKWSFFYDCNNQTGLIGRWDPKALEFLQSFGAMHVPLTRNCRNTRPIVEKIVKLTKCDMGAANQGNGPEVQTISIPSTQVIENILEQTLNKLLASGMSASQITILSPLSWEKSCVSRLSDQMLRSIIQLDEYSMREFPQSKISFSRVHDFKGLENTAVIIVDIDKSFLSQEPPSILYVGMSRARAYLVLLLCDD